MLRPEKRTSRERPRRPPPNSSPKAKIAAPYVLRAYPGAPVATPLDWAEVRHGLHPSQFNITNARERFAEKGDLFAGVLERQQQLEGPLKKLERLFR